MWLKNRQWGLFYSFEEVNKPGSALLGTERLKGINWFNMVLLKHLAQFTEPKSTGISQELPDNTWSWKALNHPAEGTTTNSEHPYTLVTYTQTKTFQIQNIPVHWQQVRGHKETPNLQWNFTISRNIGNHLIQLSFYRGPKKALGDKCFHAVLMVVVKEPKLEPQALAFIR